MSNVVAIAVKGRPSAPGCPQRSERPPGTILALQHYMPSPMNVGIRQLTNNISLNYHDHRNHRGKVVAFKPTDVWTTLFDPFRALFHDPLHDYVYTTHGVLALPLISEYYLSFIHRNDLGQTLVF
jgi:hypothetical protein